MIPKKRGAPPVPVKRDGGARLRGGRMVSGGGRGRAPPPGTSGGCRPRRAPGTRPPRPPPQWCPRAGWPDGSPQRRRRSPPPGVRRGRVCFRVRFIAIHSSVPAACPRRGRPCRCILCRERGGQNRKRQRRVRRRAGNGSPAPRQRPPSPPRGGPPRYRPRPPSWR